MKKKIVLSLCFAALAATFLAERSVAQVPLPKLDETAKEIDALFEKESVADGPKWRRGCLHTHSRWSDGNALPELVIQWYRDAGYDFMTLSDHTVLQFGERWLKVADGASPERFDALKASLGDLVETRLTDGKQEVRLHTAAELMKIYSKPNEFLLIPGHEQNEDVSGRQLHNIVMNVVDTIPFQRADTIEKAIRANAAAAEKHAQENGRPVFFMVNHPEWIHFSVLQDDLINNPEVLFYELCNADSPPRPIGKYNKEFWDRERFWDVAIAFRLANGDPPIYGTATDDAHAYFQPGAIASPGIGWVAVRTEKLTTPAILDAMRRGDFYASTGAELDDLIFNRETGELTVKVAAEDGVSYKIEFVGTKKNFDRTKKTFDYPEDDGFPARSGFYYSKEIGQTFATVDGPVGTYKLKPDDLYVRAIVTSDKKTAVPARNKPENEILWTQPVYLP